MAKKKLTSEFFLFQVRRLETLVPKNHFVREVAPFPISGHIWERRANFYLSEQKCSGVIVASMLVTGDHMTIYMYYSLFMSGL